jgi:PAS domain S-box-containing protein
VPPESDRLGRSQPERPLGDLDFTVESSLFGRMRLPTLMLVTAIAYLALARLAALWTHDAVAAPAFWPAAGVGIGIGLHVARNKRPYVLVAVAFAAVINNALFIGLSLWQDAVVLLAIVLEFSTAMFLIQRVFERRRNMGFDNRSAAVVVVMFVSAAVGASVVVLGLGVTAPWTMWHTWTLGVGLGNAVVGGVIMTFHRPNSAAARAQVFEKPVLLTVGILATIGVSTTAFSSSGPLAYVVIAMALVLSARFGTWVSGPTSSAIIVLANIRTFQGAGPFGGLPDATLHVQVFGAVLIFSTLLVGRHGWNATARARREQALLALLPDEVTTHRPDGTVIDQLATTPDTDPYELDALLERWPDLASQLPPARLVYDVDAVRQRHIEARLIPVDEGTMMCLRRDMTDELDLVRQLERANEHWKRLAATAYEGFVEIDRDRRVVYVSDRWAEMYGLPVDEITGRRVDDLFSGALYDRIREAGPNAGASIITFEYRHTRPDGDQVWVLVSQDARFDADGFAGAVAFAADTTELHTALARREVAELRLATLERRERQRVARFLHDGPLQTMVALSFQLNAAISGDWSHTSADQLERMALDAIDDMRNGLEELVPADVTGGRVGVALLAATTRFHGPEAPEIDIVDDVDESVDEAIATTLYLIGREAVVNAILHARATSIRVSITSDSSAYHLEVVDDGIGFDHRRAAGPGHLGMTSMRQRAQQLGGSCDVVSIEPTGTRVKVSVPRAVTLATASSATDMDPGATQG